MQKHLLLLVLLVCTHFLAAQCYNIGFVGDAEFSPADPIPGRAGLTTVSFIYENIGDDLPYDTINGGESITICPSLNYLIKVGDVYGSGAEYFDFIEFWGCTYGTQNKLLPTGVYEFKVNYLSIKDSAPGDNGADPTTGLHCVNINLQPSGYHAGNDCFDPLDDAVDGCTWADSSCQNCDSKVSGVVAFKDDCASEMIYPCGYCKVNIVNENNPSNMAFNFSDPMGNYTLKRDPGTYILSLEEEMYNTTYEAICPSSNETLIELEELNTELNGVDLFFETPVGVDAFPEIYTISNPRSTFNFEIKIAVQNVLGQTNAGILKIEYDNVIGESFISSSISPQFIDQANGYLEFDVSNLDVGENREISIVFRTEEDVTILDEFCATAILCVDDDTIFENDTSYHCARVVSSYDPNLIEVHQLSNGNEFDGGYIYTNMNVREFDEVTYTVRFQNIGTAPAIDVFVLDYLNPKHYEMESLQILESSHLLNASVENNILRCVFEDINLPSLEVDEQGSNGHFSYSIKLRPAITDTIKNEAVIVFDNNAPIITNEVNLVPAFDVDLDGDGFTVGEDCDDTDAEINPDAEEIPNNGIDEDCDGMDLLSSTFEIANAHIEIYPNPVFDILKIDVTGSLEYKLELYDLRGKRIFIGENLKSISLANIASGLYVLKLQDLNSTNHIIERVIVSNH